MANKDKIEYKVEIEFDASLDDEQFEKIVGRHSDGSGTNLMGFRRDLHWYVSNKRSAKSIYNKLTKSRSAHRQVSISEIRHFTDSDETLIKVSGFGAKKTISEYKKHGFNIRIER